MLWGFRRWYIMTYSANQGDIVLIDFSPQAGNEQMGKRPALIISGNDFHKRFKKTAMVCPITRTDKGIPTQVKLDNRTKTTGVIMSEQAKMLDITMRKVVFIEAAPPEIVNQVIGMLHMFTQPMEIDYGIEGASE